MKELLKSFLGGVLVLIFAHAWLLGGLIYQARYTDPNVVTAFKTWILLGPYLILVPAGCWLCIHPIAMQIKRLLGLTPPR